MMGKNSLEKAIAIIGSKRQFAIKLKVDRQNIYNWLSKGLPAEWVLPIEKITKGQITRYELRPDIYPKEEK